jgi:hypothetical protein
MVRFTFLVDEVVIFNHTDYNITATLSALSSLNKGVTRNLGGFFMSKAFQSTFQKKAKMCL